MIQIRSSTHSSLILINKTGQGQQLNDSKNNAEFCAKDTLLNLQSSVKSMNEYFEIFHTFLQMRSFKITIASQIKVSERNINQLTFIWQIRICITRNIENTIDYQYQFPKTWQSCVKTVQNTFHYKHYVGNVTKATASVNKFLN